MNDLPWFDGSNYITLDGQAVSDYSAAASYNSQLVSNAYSSFYNPNSPMYDASMDANKIIMSQPVSTILANGNSPKTTAGQVTGWDWLTPIVGGVVNAAGQIAGIEVQNRINLANQDAAKRLAATTNKVTPPTAASSMGWLLPAALALGAVLLATRG